MEMTTLSALKLTERVSTYSESNLRRGNALVTATNATADLS